MKHINYLDPYNTGVDRFVAEQLDTGLGVQDWIRRWRPEEFTATGHVSHLPMDALTVAQSRHVDIKPTVDPVNEIIASRISGVIEVNDMTATLEQLGVDAFVTIEADGSRAFNKYWKNVGKELNHPKDATVEETGLTVVSIGYDFNLIRQALQKRYRQRTKIPMRTVDGVSFPDRPSKHKGRR